jgi:protein-tyrosine kinase
MTIDKTQIGNILIEKGLIDLPQASKIAEFQSTSGLKFGEAAIKLGFVNETDINNALSSQFKYTYIDTNSSFLEQFFLKKYIKNQNELRNLRTELILRWINLGKNIIPIADVSNNPEYPKSPELAALLAIVFSQLGKKTLLVDANISSPIIHGFFKIDNIKGLSDLLADRASESILCKNENIDKLDIMTAGTSVPNSQEILAQLRYNNKLQEIATEYDVVIVSFSNCMLTNEYLMMSELFGGIVLTIEKNLTTYSELNRIVDDLSKIGKSLIGHVFYE